MPNHKKTGQELDLIDLLPIDLINIKKDTLIGYLNVIVGEKYLDLFKMLNHIL